LVTGWAKLVLSNCVSDIQHNSCVRVQQKDQNQSNIHWSETWVLLMFTVIANKLRWWETCWRCVMLMFKHEDSCWFTITALSCPAHSHHGIISVIMSSEAPKLGFNLSGVCLPLSRRGNCGVADWVVPWRPSLYLWGPSVNTSGTKTL